MTSEPCIDISFVLTGTFAPDIVTRELRLSPSKTWRVGDTIGRTAARFKHDGWLYGAGPSSTFEIEPAIIALLNMLEPFKNQMEAVVTTHGLHRELAVTVHVSSQMPTLFMSAALVVRLAEWRVDLDIDLL